MKKAILMMVLTASVFSSFAQSNKQKVGGYGAAVSELTYVDGKPALNLGAYGGVLINHKFLIGAAGNNISFKHTINGKKENLRFNYYGLYSEYRMFTENKVGISLAVTGALGWQENDLTTAQKTNKRDGDYTYVIQPKLGMNVKTTKFMQVQLYGSYRFTGNTNSSFYTPRNYNGVSAGVGLVFGSF